MASNKSEGFAPGSVGFSVWLGHIVVAKSSSWRTSLPAVVKESEPNCHDLKRGIEDDQN
jgi:hypothetical protein